MTEISSPPVIPGLSVDQDALLTQLVAGPTIREVATHVPQPALKALYPNLSIVRTSAVVCPFSLRQPERPPSTRLPLPI